MSKHPTQLVPSSVWKNRLQCIVGGLFLLLISWWQLHHGIFGWIAYNGQPVFAYSGITAGIVLILATLAPARLIAKIAAIRKYKPYRPGQGHAGPH